MNAKLSAQDVLDFWFADGMRKRWFNSTPAFDCEIRNRFAMLWQAASAGDLDSWLLTASGTLALVIVTDQLPLNMFRNLPAAFATEARAIAATKHALSSGFDRSLDNDELVFLYMPLMHSESLADQDQAVALFAAAGLTDNLRFARHHRDLVRRFGRFPHRNAILGRPSTDEELVYLASKEAFSG